MEEARRLGPMRTYNIDCSGVPVFRAEGGKALCDLRPVLASNLVPTCRSIGMASATRPRLVDDNHLDVKGVRRVRAQRLDDGSFCQGSRRIRSSEKDGRGVQQGPNWDDCNFFSLLYSISVLGYRWRRRKTCSRRGLDPADLGLTKFHNLRMRVRRESLGPLLDGHLRQVLWLPRVVEWAAGKLDGVYGENRGNEGETFGISPWSSGASTIITSPQHVPLRLSPLALSFPPPLHHRQP